MASAGSGTIQHVAGEIKQMMTGVSLQHVPYRGQAPALTDLNGGQVQVMLTVCRLRSSISAPARSALVATTAARSDVLSQLPSVRDFVPGFGRAPGMASYACQHAAG